MNWDGQERRSNKRYGVKKLGIQYSKTRLLSFLGSYSEKYLVINVSEGGLYFMTRENLLINQKLFVKLGSPHIDSSITAGIEVVWSAKSSEHDAFKIGARFVKLSEKNQKRLRKLLEEAVLDKIDFSTSIYLREVDRL